MINNFIHNFVINIIQISISNISFNFNKELYEISPVKKWIKQIPFNKTVSIEKYNNKEHFKLIAEIVLDIEEKNGKKQRNTVIRFVPKIEKNEFEKKTEWLYLFLINGRIVKIGGTRTGIKGRISSYLCGHHILERGKTGDCSKTNGFIYNTFEFYLLSGCKIEMYGYELPIKQYEIEILGIKTMIVVQTYHAYESSFLEDHKKKYGDLPVLCNNGDPEYRD